MKLIDGGLSTELVRLGAEIDDPLWTGRVLLDNPSLVEEAHRAFVAAGARAVITSSYQLSRAGFVASGMTERDADSALVTSVRVARSAVHKPTHPQTIEVAASVGPFGAITHDGAEYRGNYGVSGTDLAHFHRERLSVLASAKPDVFAVETIPDLDETYALRDVLSEHPTVPKWFSFSCADDTHLWSGCTIEDAVRAIAETPGLVAVGVNCVDPEFVTPLVRRIRRVTPLPILAYPNRGGTWDAATGVWVGNRRDSFSDWLPEWESAGVSIVGGCCGTDSRDIADLHEHILRRD